MNLINMNYSADHFISVYVTFLCILTILYSVLPVLERSFYCPFSFTFDASAC